MKYTVLALIAFAALVAADCPNACSGHGDCGTKDACTCYDTWLGADCSERVCPFGLAFVDVHFGDLNHDGQVTATTNSATMLSKQNHFEQWPSFGQTDEAHFWSECSAKGSCDREVGACQCHDGYTGSACQRTTCPNECSGHGVCRTVEEIAVDALTDRRVSSIGGENIGQGVESGFDYKLWDMDKNQGCVCDPGFSGADCSLRECPRGDDPLTHLENTCGGATCADEVQTITLTVGGTTGIQDSIYISFKEWTGITWTTDLIFFDTRRTADGDHVNEATVNALMEHQVQEALVNIPNNVFEDVTVSVTNGLTASVSIAITFDKNPGNIDTVTVTQPSTNFVRYQLQGGSGVPVAAYKISAIAVAETTSGNKEEVTCSNRGLCDYETGLCKCFKGYFHDDCSVQSALAF